MRRLTVLLAALVPIAIVIGSPPDIASELKAIREEYTKAQQDFFKEIQAAKGEEAQTKIYNEKNPAPKFKAKLRDLAKRANGDPAEFDVLVFPYDLERQTAQEGGKECADLANDIVARFGTNPKIAQFAQMIDWPIPPTESRALLAKLLDLNRGKASEPTLLYRLASNYKGWGQPAPEDEKRATDLLQELVAKHPNAAETKRAKGDLFELQNLVVGKTFPEFDAKDENDGAWKLSDYRGKVVVLDFWGFW